MFGSLIRALIGGRRGGKAIHILRKTYSLEVSHPEQLNMMKRISENFGELYNEHEMAVLFLVQFSKTIKPEHPLAKREVEKYIRMSKGAYNRGLVQSEDLLNELFEVAKSRFGIEANQIKAA